MFSPGVEGRQLTLFVDIFGLGGNSDNVGLDNISFSQVAVSAVPLPAGFTLLLGALGLLALGRRRFRV